MSTSTYVYDGKEVVMTGRTAVKSMKSGNLKTLYEVRPVEAEPDQKMYNQWVSMDDLYVITEKDEDNS